MSTLQANPSHKWNAAAAGSPLADSQTEVPLAPRALLPPPPPPLPPLMRLRAVALLAGSVRQTPFAAGIGRSVLDLPWDNGQTILDLWCEQVATLAPLIRWERPAIQVLIDQRGVAPTTRAAGAGRPAVDVSIHRDRSELRGTGGLLRDVAEAYADDDYLLVAHAAQVLRDPLARAAVAAAAKGGDVGLLAHGDGSPVSLWLVRCGCLRHIQEIGYVDFMEQCLPQIAERGTVTVAYRNQPNGLPLRTHDDYIRALRWHYRERWLGAAASDPLAEDWQPLFRLAEAGAEVAAGADVFDSVILDGARVEAGATVVRSVLCPGAVIRRGQHVVGQLARGVFAAAAAAAAAESRRPAMIATVAATAAAAVANAASAGETKQPGPVWAH